jgi:hypothetical protein
MNSSSEEAELFWKKLFSKPASHNRSKNTIIPLALIFLFYFLVFFLHIFTTQRCDLAAASHRGGTPPENPSWFWLIDETHLD